MRAIASRSETICHGGGIAAGAEAAKRRLAAVRTLDHDDVLAPLRACHRRSDRHQHRLYRRRHAIVAGAVGQLGARDLPDRAVEPARIHEVDWLDRSNRPERDGTGVNAASQTDRREDRQLRAGIATVDIRCRIRLGVPLPLRFGECCVEGQRRIRLHPCQDVVAGAVQHSRHPAETVARQPLTHRPDDRHAAGDRGLEQQVPPVRGCHIKQLRASVGDHLLVGGHDRLARLQRLTDPSGGRIGPADHFHDDVGVRGENIGELRGPADIVRDPSRRRPLPLHIAVADMGQSQRPPVSPAEDPGDRLAHRPESSECDLQHTTPAPSAPRTRHLHCPAHDGQRRHDRHRCQEHGCHYPKK